MINAWETMPLNVMLTDQKEMRISSVKDPSEMATAVHDFAVARKSDRKRVLLRATLFTPDGAHSVRIRDISSTGAHVFGEVAVPSGCDIIFKRDPIFVAGRISWSTDKGIGVEFYRELSDSEVGSAAPSLVRDLA
jgi:hypothetical protein